MELNRAELGRYQKIKGAQLSSQSSIRARLSRKERPKPAELSPTHGFSIEPHHVPVGIALGWVKPYLDAGATASAVVAQFVGVAPDLTAQSGRCREGEMEGVQRAPTGYHFYLDIQSWPL